ncbi:MAG: aspartate 1-decarboxylase [Chloroflexi bacterium]|nr:aspartate 1-decarboxylase [Chloroflexota bacterium]
MLKSKIHRARVTEANINYEGSLTIDKTLMDAADIIPFEMVYVLDINNGARLETYAIEGEADSGIICANGAAARLIHPGDKVIILTYQTMMEQEARNIVPKLIYVDSSNTMINSSVTSGFTH